MQAIAVVLTIVASLLCHRHVAVYCNAPPGYSWRHADGYEAHDPDRIWLEYCVGTIRLRRYPVTVFAHELIHAEHHDWPHSRVYALQSWYEPIVARKIRAER